MVWKDMGLDLELGALGLIKKPSLLPFIDPDLGSLGINLKLDWFGPNFLG